MDTVSFEKNTMLRRQELPFKKLSQNFLYTGCPTKHDSMQDDLNVVLIFDIICCVYLST